jgi:DNA-binding transcriptional ArsR family regulator
MHALRILSEPRRQQTLRLIWRRELSAGEIHRGIGEISFGAVSQHLRVLREAGLVRVRSQGRHRYYRAVPEELGPLAQWLEQTWAVSLDRLRELAEDEIVPPPTGEEPRS